jgi:hypothetical protein
MEIRIEKVFRAFFVYESILTKGGEADIGSIVCCLLYSAFAEI